MLRRDRKVVTERSCKCDCFFGVVSPLGGAGIAACQQAKPYQLVGLVHPKMGDSGLRGLNASGEVCPYFSLYFSVYYWYCILEKGIVGGRVFYDGEAV